jgi:CBS-domain-containing membrane protein
MTDPQRPRYPIGGHMSDVVLGIARRFRLPALEQRHSSRIVLGIFAGINGCISIGLLALVALITGQPFVFPSLGPTAFLLFYTPHMASAWPRNTLCGHAIGVFAGWFALVVFGLQHAGPAVAVGVSPARIGAAAVSLGLTALLMVWFGVPHPPAGATTLIISLGILTTLTDFVVLLVGVALLVVQGIVINRLAGVDYPLWSRPLTE